jgi:hypothetical protein
MEGHTKPSLPAHQRVVLSCQTAGFIVKDVLDTAWVRGELQPVWTRLVRALDAVQAVDTSGLEVDDEALQSMSDEFRYEKDLLTSEETERWLANRDLTEEDFSDYFLRHYWLGKEPPPLVDAAGSPGKDLRIHLNASPELRETLRVEAMFSGEFDSMARSLSWRLAAKCAEPGAEPSADLLQVERTEFENRMGLSGPELAPALNQIDRDTAWLNWCLGLELGYRLVCQHILTDAQRSRVLGARRLPLTQVEVETLLARSQDAAKEAVLCLREDSLSMRELAAQCGGTSQQACLFIGDCSNDLQQSLFSTSPGEIFGPLPQPDGFVVGRLLSKSDPDLSSPAVRERIDRALLETHFGELAAKNVRWELSGISS